MSLMVFLWVSSDSAHQLFAELGLTSNRSGFAEKWALKVFAECGGHMSECKLVLCTCPDDDSAQRIAKQLVEQRLAACVSMSASMTSVYRWQGDICQDREVQLVIKTHEQQLPQLFKQVLSLHPYDVPEWLVLDVAGGSEAYLDWIKSSLHD